MRTLLSLAALATVGLASTAAQAALISEDINFSLSGFVDIGGSTTPPITTITGAVTIVYDPTLTYDSDTADLTIHSFTGITLDSPLGFTYQNGFLEIGGTQNDSDIVSSNTNDLVVSLNVTNPNNPTFIPCSTPGYTCGSYTGSDLVEAAGYTLQGYNTGWFYGAPQSVVAVPEPETYALMLAGLGLLGAVARRQRRGAAAR